MSNDWYVLQGEKERGPFSQEQLQAFARKRKLNPGALVRRGTSGPWTSASDVPGLFKWIDEARPSRTTKPRSQSKAPEVSPASHWKLFIAIGVTAVLSTTLAVATCFVLLGGRHDDGPPDGAVVASAEQQPPQAAEVVHSTAASAERAAETTSEPPVMELPPVQPEPAGVVGGAPGAEAPQTAKSADAADETEAEPKQQAAEPEEKVADKVPEKPDLDPKPLLPPIPEEKVEIADDEIREFDKSVRLERRAKDACARYNVFSQSFAFTDEQREQVDAELAEWKERADQDLYRLGGDWVTGDEVKKAEEDAESLIQQAAALVKIGSWDACIEKLEDANRVNPNGIKAPYILGLIWSLEFAGQNGPDIAERSFRTVLLRHPEHAGALNSIAIAEIKQRHYGVALTNFARAAELTDKCPEVIQNLGRFVFLAESNRIATQRSTLRRYTDLYAQLLADEKGPEFNSSVGWLHMLPVFPQRERDEQQPQPIQVTAGGAQLEPKWGGSGFVVAPGYVMTNRHVVDDDNLGICDVVRLADPENPTADLPGNGVVIAASDTADLAIVHLPGLKAPAMRLRPKQVALATDVMILGYPRGQVFGVGMKATRGVVSGLPDVSRPVCPGYYLFDATSDHGNSGGPVIDMSGQVLAVLTIGYGRQIRDSELEADFSGGVPSVSAIEFASEEIEGFEPEVPEIESDDADSWAAMVARISPSIFRLTTYYKAGVPALEVAAHQAGYQNSIWEDRTCPNCNGKSWLPCPGRGCAGGKISVPYFESVVTNTGAGAVVVNVKKFRKENCPVCRGTGRVDCPGCRDGTDSHLR